MSKLKPAALPAGTVVGGYQIVKKLAAGGFGVVYLAEDAKQHMVAVKEYLPSSLAERAPGELIPRVKPDKQPLYRLGLKSFFEEGRSLAQISHPSVVSVLNFFRENETVYMVMNYLQGETLQDFIVTARDLKRDKVFRESTIRSLYDEVLRGLRIVHQHKMLHLDIKPANVFITNDNKAVMLDFGAAREVLSKEGNFIRPMYTPGFAAPEMYRRDGNFRPVDLEFAPDGSLYFIDWHNPLIGHMQHNARDPNRDRERGRIYRITYPERPLVKPAKIDGASVAELLEVLKEPEYRTRYRARRELRGHAPAEVLPAVKAWVAKLDKQDAAYEHHLCEALWATWAQNQPDAGLIAELLKAKRFEARAAAVDVIRHSFWQLPNHVELLNQAVRDEHARVRLTAVVAATWLDNADGAKIAVEAFKLPVDRWVGPVLHYALTYTLKDDVDALKAAGQLNLDGNQAAADYFSGKLKIGQPVAEAGTNSKPSRKLTAAEEKAFKLGREIYFRDAHCATCHQADGKGIQNIYPPLAKSNWLDDDERLTKILLKGLWGPITVNGQHFDPTKGVPPMMGFGGLLNDEEAAAVLSYVRLSFGNNGKLVSPATVKKVREATKDRVNFYMADELLKEHPLKAAPPAKKK